MGRVLAELIDSAVRVFGAVFSAMSQKSSALTLLNSWSFSYSLQNL